MSENKAKADPQVQPSDEQDVEGHNMMISPTLSRDIARAHSKDIDRAVKERNRAKEAKR